MENKLTKEFIKIGNQEVFELDYKALVPQKKEVEKVVLQSKKSKNLILNEQKNIALLSEKSEPTLKRHINLLKQQMEMAFLQRNIEGYIQCQVKYWQAFTALTFPKQKTTLNCDEIREIIKLNN
ncbi:MAG: hypothetical protein EAY66_07280 [Sphingobacteriales bacterium]|nr:MAG: hypothetical protein EAY66_07280 [Sphingobacteriales bacterium]